MLVETIRNLSIYVRRHVRAYALGVAMMVVNAFFTTLTPIIPGMAFDALKQGTMTLPRMWLYVGALLGTAGAGGLANAVPEILDADGCGGRIRLLEIPSDEPGMSPLEIWCNEAQERYVVVVAPSDRERFMALCARERCPAAVIGEATGDARLVLEDRLLGGTPVDMPMEVLLGKPPRMLRDVAHEPPRSVALPAGVVIDRHDRRTILTDQAVSYSHFRHVFSPSHRVQRGLRPLRRTRR